MPSQIDVISFEDESGNKLKAFAAPFAVQLGSGLSGSISGSKITIVSALPHFPVGSLFLTLAGTDPAAVFGYGTWLLIGQGQMLITPTVAA